MAAQLDRPVQTFTIGFEDREGFDERPYAQAGRRAPRAPTTTSSSCSPDAVDLVERLVWHHDQPFGDSSAVPTFLLSELTRGARDGGAVGRRRRRGCSPATSASRPGLRRAASRRCRRRCGARRAARSGCSRRGRCAAEPAGCSASRGSPSRACRTPTAPGSATSRTPSATRCSTGAATTGALEDYRAIWERSAGAHPLDRLLDLNLRTYLLDDLLVKTDRMSMAHGLEVRCPFLDTELLALRRPPAAAPSRPAA